MDELFEQARKDSIKKVIEQNININEMEVVDPSTFQNNVLAIIRERVEEGETQWDLLKRMVDGSFTERFIDVMNVVMFHLDQNQKCKNMTVLFVKEENAGLIQSLRI